jgi:hypothetical protein
MPEFIIPKILGDPTENYFDELDKFMFFPFGDEVRLIC